MMSVGALAAALAWIFGNNCGKGSSSNSTSTSGRCFWYSFSTAVSANCWSSFWTPMKLSLMPPGFASAGLAASDGLLSAGLAASDGLVAAGWAAGAAAAWVGLAVSAGFADSAGFVGAAAG